VTATWPQATLWLGLALLASLLSIWLRVATAMSEIVVGAIAQLPIGAFVAGRCRSYRAGVQAMTASGRPRLLARRRRRLKLDWCHAA
jgi:hypothetical protein